MRPPALAAAVLVVLVAQPVLAQLSDDQLREQRRRAEAEPTAPNLLQAANAARLMRDYEAARELLEAAWEATRRSPSRPSSSPTSPATSPRSSPAASSTP